jgi:2-polyprenyl-3-methyl-5-hydroxy-6-metoxy-1,4-benzoquinol methylase
VGLRSRLLEIPIIYETLQNGIIRPEGRDWLAADFIGAARGMTVLDVGCGTGDIVSRLHDASYIGIDHNPRYIRTATERYGRRGKFTVLDVNDAAFKALGKFDRILLIGVLHHLTDAECLRLLPRLREVLKPEGRLITIDPAVEIGQHPIALMLARLDRGRYTRSATGYRELIKTSFVIETEVVRHDLLRVPYTHAAFRATRLDAAQPPLDRIG